MNDKWYCCWTIITGAQCGKRARKQSVMLWCTENSDFRVSYLCQTLYFKLAFYAQATWKMSYVPRGKRANLTKGATWVPELIKAFKIVEGRQS